MEMLAMKVAMTMVIILVPTLLSVNGNDYTQLPLPSGVGPESIAFNCRGEGPYTGISDGRILKWQGGDDPVWTEFAVTTPHRRRDLCDGSEDPQLESTCGRVLGLQFHNATCNLYIADAYYGLMMVGPDGGVATSLASSAEGILFHFTNGVDVDQDTGDVYFTDSSMLYERRQNLMEIASGDQSGRFMKYNPNTKEVKVLATGIAFANGVALSKDKTYVLIVETSYLQILRYWLQGPLAMTLELFALVPGFPDNIRRNDKGEFWVGLNNGKTEPSLKEGIIGVRLDQEGNILEALYGNGLIESVSEVNENNGTILVGSVITHYVALSPLL